MASIAIMIGGAALNAAAFISGNYLACSLTTNGTATQEEKVQRHDEALEAYQAAYAKYTQDCTKLLDWIATNTQMKEQAKQKFTNTDIHVQTLQPGTPRTANDTTQRTPIL